MSAFPVVVFCGPTISPDQVRAVLPEATCLPPVSQGDVLQALRHRPRAIGIVDGYFDQVPAVWHKEILYVLERGVHVYGSSSMGALRAAELHPFGMVGVGEVFEAFRSGRYEDDDEVAVFHGPAEDGYRAVGQAMVDLRDRFERAAAAGVIAEDVAEKLIAVAKGLHYRDRTVAAVAHHARDHVDAADLAAIRAFVADDGPGIKHRDALAMLDALGALAAADPPPFEASFDLPRTVFFDALYNEVDRVLAGRQHEAEFDPTVVLWTGETMPIVKKQQLLRVLARLESERLGLAITPEEIEQTTNNFRRQYGLIDPEETQRWLTEADLDWEQFLAAMADMTAVEKMERVYKLEVDAGVARLIKLAEARRRTNDARATAVPAETGGGGTGGSGPDDEP